LPFGAALNTKRVPTRLPNISKSDFFIVGEIPATLKIANELVCLQMMIQ
jgi:hypothetical protein